MFQYVWFVFSKGLLQISPVERGVVTLLGVRSGLFVAMSRRGKLYGSVSVEHCDCLPLSNASFKSFSTLPEISLWEMLTLLILYLFILSDMKILSLEYWNPRYQLITIVPYGS